LLERINITSLAPMMPLGAVHPIIPGRRSKAEASPESMTPQSVVMDSGLSAFGRAPE
jgi:hypothetical protein